MNDDAESAQYRQPPLRLVQFKTRQADWERLNQAASERLVSKSVLIRQAVNEFLDKNQG